MAPIILTLTEFEYLSDLYDEEALYPYYSGRGMYGKTCLGYVGSDSALFIFDLAKLLAERDTSIEASADDVREMMESLGSGSKDSMGLDTITYFRSIGVEPGAKQEEEEEEEEDW